MVPLPPAGHDYPLLGPIIGLNLWTFAIEGLLYKRRIPAISKYNIQVNPAVIKKQMAERFPPFVQWAADNYNHLLEQPTQFYAVALVLSFLGVRDKLSVRMAWAYVAIRVLHSLVHVSSNRIMVRVTVFAASSFTLLGLTLRAAYELS